VLNYTKDDFKNIVGRVYNRRKKVQGGTGSNQYVQSGHFDHSAKTEHDVADQFGVSPRTVRRAAKFNEKVEEENKLEIRTGFR
jgi:hypothetical protein